LFLFLLFKFKEIRGFAAHVNKYLIKRMLTEMVFFSAGFGINYCLLMEKAELQIPHSRGCVEWGDGAGLA